MVRSLTNLLCQLRNLVDQSPAAQWSDKQLLDGFVAEHAERAFAVLLGRYGSMVMGVCTRILRDKHAAEDAYQATFLVLARKADPIESKTSLASWLYRVAYRISLRVHKHRQRLNSREQEMIDMPCPLPENRYVT